MVSANLVSTLLTSFAAYLAAVWPGMQLTAALVIVAALALLASATLGNDQGKGE